MVDVSSSESFYSRSINISSYRCYVRLHKEMIASYRPNNKPWTYNNMREREREREREHDKPDLKLYQCKINKTNSPPRLDWKVHRLCRQ
jgi:hypothetical protein